MLIVAAGLSLASARAAAQSPAPQVPPQSPSRAPASSAAPSPTPQAQTPPAPPQTAANAARATATGASNVPVQPEYRIGAGDKLQINVYKESDLSPALQVRPDGRITMPLVGDIPAAGQTPMQLQRRLAESLREYVANPVVTVMVTEVADRVVYVMGEVVTPGAIPLKGSLTVLQALAMAGGFKEFAKPGSIKVLRKVANSDRVETIPFRYKDAIRNDAQVFYLAEGDTVVVP